MNDELNQMHIRTVLILLIQLSGMTKWKRESDCNISFVYNSCRPREMEWEDVSPLHIYTYICIFVGRDTDATVNEEEDTSKKLIKKFWFAKECQRYVVQTLLWFEKHMDEIVIMSSRKRFLYAVVISKRWSTTELCIIQRIRRWRFLTE